MRRSYVITTEGNLMLHKKGRDILYEDSIEVKINKENSYQLFKVEKDKKYKYNTEANGEILNEAITLFREEFGDFTENDGNTVIEFNISMENAKFILLMSRKQGFVNFILDYYFKKREEEKNEE